MQGGLCTELKSKALKTGSIAQRLEREDLELDDFCSYMSILGILLNLLSLDFLIS